MGWKQLDVNSIHPGRIIRQNMCRRSTLKIEKAFVPYDDWQNREDNCQAAFLIISRPTIVTCDSMQCIGMILEGKQKGRLFAMYFHIHDHIEVGFET